MPWNIYQEFMQLPEIDRLKHDKMALEYTINHECLGDAERWPYKCELERVEKRLKELEKSE